MLLNLTFSYQWVTSHVPSHDGYDMVNKKIQGQSTPRHDPVSRHPRSEFCAIRSACPDRDDIQIGRADAGLLVCVVERSRLGSEKEIHQATVRPHSNDSDRCSCAHENENLTPHTTWKATTQFASDCIAPSRVRISMDWVTSIRGNRM